MKWVDGLPSTHTGTSWGLSEAKQGHKMYGEQIGHFMVNTWDVQEDVLEADNQDWLASALELLWEDLQSIAAGSPTIGGLLRLLVAKTRSSLNPSSVSAGGGHPSLRCPCVRNCLPSTYVRECAARHVLPVPIAHQSTAIIYYLFFTRPNPFLAALDFYFLRPLADNTANKWRSADFALREKLGGGNFGAAFEGVKVEVGAMQHVLYHTVIHAVPSRTAINAVPCMIYHVVTHAAPFCLMQCAKRMLYQRVDTFCVMCQHVGQFHTPHTFHTYLAKQLIYGTYTQNWRTLVTSTGAAHFLLDACRALAI
eukprot:1157557-Pelagomonas_calceolata.AAC.2